MCLLVLLGAAYGPQLGAIERGVDFLVATPGRLLDILEKGAWDPMKTVSVVLDEADEMLKCVCVGIALGDVSIVGSELRISRSLFTKRG